MIPIIQEKYGPPSRDFSVSIVRNLYFNNSAVYFPNYNEIHMNDIWNPQLLTHELIHAFRDNIMLSTNQNWEYDGVLDGFEEAFAEQISFDCMNEYVRRYPSDPYVDTTKLYYSLHGWDYDFVNDSNLSSTYFNTDHGGMALSRVRYNAASSALSKIEVENQDFAKYFNQAWYQVLNANHAITVSRHFIIKLIDQQVSRIENMPAAQWIDEQRIFDATIQTGYKIWLENFHTPDVSRFYIWQSINYYETFPNGSDWDDGSGTFYHMNGSIGSAKLYDFANNLVWSGGLLIEPVDNPPVWYGIGRDIKSLSSGDNDTGEDWISGLHNLDLYKFELSFPEVNKTVYRIVGDELTNFAGIWGAVKNANGGVIYIDHEGYAPEPPLTVSNSGVFYGRRSWAGLLTGLAGQPKKSIPGKVNIRYIDRDGNEYRRQINIDYGSWNGNQIFFLEFPQCGNAFVEIGEQCDNGTNNGAGGCLQCKYVCMGKQGYQCPAGYACMCTGSEAIDDYCPCVP